MRKKAGTTIGARLRKYLFTGLATLLPLFITFYIIVFIFEFTNRFAGRHINDLLMREYGFAIPGLGLILLTAFVILAGALVSNFLGRKLFELAERFFYKAPLVANIYPSAKKLSDFLFREEEKKKFRKVVLVEYPSPGSYSVGFVTNEGVEDFDKKTGEELVTVLVPLSPMPYSGLLMVLPREKLFEIDMTVNEAIQLVLSGGVVTPDKK
ncbi:MAG: DUF502 domain-containing protein [Candidatus Omnitrophica bacterium]|nr:DUF502 domain-containing protein [Candidatus Omnitrophota bacterium]